MPVIDFTQIEGPKLLPDGKYLAKVVHAEDGLSTQNHPKTELRWEIMAPEEYAGRVIFDIISYHPDVLWRAKQALIGLGFDETFQGEITASELEGREATITVKVEKGTKTDPSTGNPYPDKNKVSKIAPVSAYASGSNGAAEALSGLSVPATEEAAVTPIRQGRASTRRGQ